MVEADPATGSQFLLFEEYGGFWADAEKSPSAAGDELLCWAATTSNMLEYTGWGFAGDMLYGDTDDFFQFFRTHVSDGGNHMNYAIDWWMTGDLISETEGAAEEIVNHDGFWDSVDIDDYVVQTWDYATAMLQVNGALRAGKPVGLTMYTDSGGVHAVTCWGYNYDPDYPPELAEHYLGLWLTDSDNDKDEYAPPNVLTYRAVHWNGTAGRWELASGGGWYIYGVVSLALFPAATRPVADAWMAYTGFEGSPVHFAAVGTFDDSPVLYYRWNVDGDDFWDADWSTEHEFEHTWLDDYPTGPVYLEVFDLRLRDMATTTVTIANVAPVVSAVGSTIAEGGTAQVSGEITDPGILDSFSVTIDWGEGEPQTLSYPAGTTSYAVSHQYLDDDPTGTSADVYAVTVTVTDDDGGLGSATTSVTVNNVAPVLNGPTLVNQPNAEFILPAVHALDFAGSWTDTGTEDTHVASWVWGDGMTETGVIVQGSGSGTVAGSHVFMAPGDYVIGLNVADDDSLADIDTCTVHVAGVDEALEIFDAYIQGLDESLFKPKAPQRKLAFAKLFDALDQVLSAEGYSGLTKVLNEGLRPRFDGLVGGNDKDDWIRQDLAIQLELCQKVDDLTAYLQYLLAVQP